MRKAEVRKRKGAYLIHRLGRLLRIRRDHFNELNEKGLRLLDRTIFAVYCDCIDIGQRDEAAGILQDVRLGLRFAA